MLPDGKGAAMAAQAKTAKLGDKPRVLDPKWDGRDTFSIEEASEILRLSRTGAYAAAKKGNLPVVRIGRRAIVPRHALESLLLG
jgi:excisionase family DNA binding protein